MDIEKKEIGRKEGEWEQWRTEIEMERGEKEERLKNGREKECVVRYYLLIIYF